MRKAINDNPTVQIVVLGVLLVVVGLLLATRALKHDSAGSAAPASATAASATGVPDAGTAGVAPTTSSGAGVVPSSPVPAPPVAPEALRPGPGLPADVVRAWTGGDAVVLLIVRGGGIDDRLVRKSVEALSGDSRTSVFVTRAKDIADYSRITQGAGVSRVPALVVVRPRRVSGGVPEALVSYGFRDSDSVVQAVHDALYSGPQDLPYYPR